jgi:RND family efflux transporter MFP subunit
MNPTCKQNSPEPDPAGPVKIRHRSPGIRLLRLLLPVLILVAGGITAFWLLQTGPQTKPRPPAPSATLVEVRQIDFGPGRAVVEAMGTVVADRQVELRPRVAGEVIEINANLLPGGSFRAGEVLLKIDPTDYELAVRQLASELSQAEAALRIEEGNQDIARREYELLGELFSDEDLDLVLRTPQLETVRARLETAAAKLEQATLALERTTVRAPFNGVVQSRQVNVGTRVSENTHFATLVGTDRFWIEVVVPVRELRWLHIPENGKGQGSLARVYDQTAWGEAVFREGRIVRLAADLEEHGRLARLLIAMDDPLHLKGGQAGGARLFIGSYVRVEIEGRDLSSVAAVPRALLRDGDQVWVMDTENKLEVRPVEVAFRGRDQVLISSGLTPDDRLIVSGLATPVPGMALRTREESGVPTEIATPAASGNKGDGT